MDKFKIAYTVDEALAAIGIGRTNFYKLANEGKVVLKKVGGRTLVTAESLHRLIEEGTQSRPDQEREDAEWQDAIGCLEVPRSIDLDRLITERYGSAVDVDRVFTASIAISLKRIAEALEEPEGRFFHVEEDETPDDSVAERARAGLENARRSIDLTRCGPIQLLEGLKVRSLAELDHLAVELRGQGWIKRAMMVRDYAAVVRDSGEAE